MNLLQKVCNNAQTKQREFSDATKNMRPDYKNKANYSSETKQEI